MRGIILSVVMALLVVVGHPVGASIIVPPENTVPCDFVTGGGFIVGSGTSDLAAGAKANFAVGGGVKNGAFWGHLEYNDHSTRPPMRVHGTSVTGYAFGPNPGTDRIITGTAQVNGAGNPGQRQQSVGVFSLRVDDQQHAVGHRGRRRRQSRHLQHGHCHISHPFNRSRLRKRVDHQRRR